MKRFIILATTDEGTFVYSSFEHFCRAFGLERKKYRVIPDEVFVDEFGTVTIERMQLNVSSDCHKLRIFLKGKFQLTTDKLVTSNGVKLEHTLIGAKGMYYITTNLSKELVYDVRCFQFQVAFDEGTEEIILKRINL